MLIQSKPARAWALGAVAALMLVVSACGGAKPNASGDATQGAGTQAPAKKEAKAITIGYLNVMDDAQAMLAYDAKLYEKHGLNVKLQPFESGTDLIKAMVGNQVDAGVLGFTNAVTWAAKGAGLKVVGGAQLGFHSILVRNDSGIKTVEDLKGKKLASQKQGSTADIVLNGVTLAQAKLTNKDLQMVYAEPAQAIQSLAGGAVDAAFVFEPYARMATLTSPVTQIYEIGKVWPFPCMVVITTDDMLKKDRDAVNRMLDAQKEAIEMLQNDPQKAADLITPRFIQGESFKTQNGEVKATSVIKDSIQSQTFNWEITPDQIKRMQEIADIMIAQKALDKPVKVEDILDLSWQQQVKK
ncbi:ABC transporter substrate-binding protein [Paenibacillus flagellatus]|uniref:ABC transporter substrate-binding protein n=1 Tax=Paenibacillus flagellatus TaxID=2211139 RepID=A0A2V5K179_9BACL|nr:ABC transporter substrate-binding protein [Paenibacillus flagellatus]PYI52878.1 ABC transporter substrate-binding protein [Paenibacillus flagellatus]